MRGKLIIGVMAFLCVSCGRAVSILDSDFSLDHVIEVEGRQGVATDGDFYYISGSTALYKYDMKGNLVAKNENPFKDLQLECNHIGDIDEYDGEIYAGCEFFLDGVGRNIQTAIYDAAHLNINDPSLGSRNPDRWNAAASPWTETAMRSGWPTGSRAQNFTAMTSRQETI